MAFDEPKARLEKIFLSPPHMGSEELHFIKEAFESNYIALLGPMGMPLSRSLLKRWGLLTRWLCPAGQLICPG